MIARGVICSSAGNHAQGVALAARKRGLAPSIVMPTTTPPIKVEAVVALGGEVVLNGLTYDDANRTLSSSSAKTGLAFVHPFDDPDVIAGQGTIALELERQWARAPAAIFVPVGGGGLIGGIGAYVKERYPEHRGRRRRAVRVREHARSRCTRANPSRSTTSARSPTASPCVASATRRFDSRARSSTRSCS